MFNKRTQLQKQRLLFTIAYFIPAAILVTLAAGLFVYSERQNFNELQTYFITDNEEDHSEQSEHGVAEIFEKGEEKKLSMAEIDTRLTANGFNPIFNDQKESPLYTISNQEISHLLNKTEKSNFFTSVETLSETEFITARDTIIQKTLKRVLIIWILALIFFIVLAYWFSGKVVAPLAEALEKQKQFVSNAAHEFRTPLSLIKTDADVIIRDPHADLNEYKNFRTRTVHSVEYLSELTTKLLQLTRLDRSTTKKKTSINITVLTQKVVDAFTPHAKKKNITLTSKIEDGIVLKTFPEDYRQLLNILLDNAIKYTPEKESIQIELSKTKNNIILKITDTGLGIPTSDREKIFDRFYRVDTSRSENSHGLGLSIAKEIITGIKGSIRATSNPKGSGTQFFITFPA